MSCEQSSTARARVSSAVGVQGTTTTLSAYRRAMSTVPSVEDLSTTMSSSTKRRDLRQVSMIAARLYEMTKPLSLPWPGVECEEGFVRSRIYLYVG